MTRQTSIEAYKYLVDSGKLAKMNRLVYQYLYNNGPTTQKKAEKGMNDTTDTVVPRFAVLKRMGLIKEVGSIKCEETGRRNLLWDVTDLKIPLNDGVKVSRKEKKQKILDMITAHGKHDLPTREEEIQLYMNELRDIYIAVNKL